MKLRLAVMCVAIAAQLASVGNAAAQQTAAQQPGAILREGIVADPARGLVYVMRPGGGISALDLTTGSVRWTTMQGDVPLAMSGTTLLAEESPRTSGGLLAVASLDVVAGGRRVARATTALGEGVRVGVGESLDGTFSLVPARVAGGDVVLHWRFVPAPLKGMEEDDSVARPVRPFGGALQLTPRTTRLRAVGAVRTPTSVRAAGVRDVALAPPPRPRWLLSGDQRLTSAAAAARSAQGTQYESADGRHVLVSQRVADDRTWDNYRWSVFERATGQALGEFQAHIPFSPFVVHNGVVVFETTPFVRAGQAPEPAKVRGISLASGREVWSVEVRELVYRGVLPP